MSDMILLEIDGESKNYPLNINTNMNSSTYIKIGILGYSLLFLLKLVLNLIEEPISVELIINSAYSLIFLDGVIIAVLGKKFLEISSIVVPLIIIGIVVGISSKDWKIAILSNLVMWSIAILVSLFFGTIFFGRSISEIIDYMLRIQMRDYFSSLITLLFFSLMGSFVK